MEMDDLPAPAEDDPITDPSAIDARSSSPSLHDSFHSVASTEIEMSNLEPGATAEVAAEVERTEANPTGMAMGLLSCLLLCLLPCLL